MTQFTLVRHILGILISGVLIFPLTQAQNIPTTDEEIYAWLDELGGSGSDNKVGLRYGYSFDQFKLSNNPEYKGIYRNQSFEIAAFIETKGTRLVHLQLELQYASAKAEGIRPGPRGPAHVDFQLELVRLPVMVKLVPEWKKLRPYVTAGPSIGILLSRSGIIQYEGKDFLEDLYVSPLLIGVTFSTGVEIPLSDMIELRLGGRYNLNHMHIFDRHNAYVLDVGLAFGLD